MDDDDSYFSDQYEGLDDSCCPPPGLRFGEGQPPNLGGRPPGSLNRKTIIKRVAAKRHRIKLDGRPRTKNTLDLVLRAIRTAASRGEVTAFDLQEDLKGRFGLRPSRTLQAVLILGEKLTGEEWVVVYGSHISDEESEERFSYLRNARSSFREHQARTQISLGSQG